MTIMKASLELILTHRGVTLGTAVAGPKNVLPSGMRSRDAEVPGQLELVFLPFQPAAAYAAIQPVCELAWKSLTNFGFLGPAADPASDAAGKDADTAARALWAEIELRDPRGSRVPGRVVTLYDQGHENEMEYWLDVAIDRDFAGVAAVLPSPDVAVQASEPPPS
jgi:hypothetical protein